MAVSVPQQCGECPQWRSGIARAGIDSHGAEET